MTNSSYNNTNIFSRLWLRLTLSGINDELDFSNIKKVKVINVASLWILISLILTNIRWYLMDLPVFILLNFISLLAMVLVIFLNSKNRYRSARSVFFLYIPFHLTLLSLVLPFGFELFFFPIMIIAGFIFENRKFMIFYLILIAAIFIFLKSNFVSFNYVEVSSSYVQMFYLLSVVLSLIMCFLSINLFIRQYEENRSEIMIKNEMLEESVYLAKEKADYTALLLREMNHRVKNNLQLISSLLNIHSEQLKDLPAKKALQDAKFRVHSIALIHKQLYKDKDINSVNIEKYIEDLLYNIRDTVPGFIEDIDFNYSCDNCVVGVDDAVSIGLIINELITNAIEHGLSEGDEKKIMLDVRKIGEDSLSIVIEDNGTGLNAGFTAANKGFGYELIETLTTSYNGSIEVDDTKNKVSVKLYLNRNNE